MLYYCMKKASTMRYNPVAKDLRTPKYKQRIVKSRKVYKRKSKHKKKEG